MKRLLFSFTLAAATLSLAVAPHAEGTKKETTNKMPAIATSSTVNLNAPVEGQNSFTQAQVTERLAKAGYGNIRDLVKGEDGIWRAFADKGGRTYTVMFDYQGNITHGTSSTIPTK